MSQPGRHRQKVFAFTALVIVLALTLVALKNSAVAPSTNTKPVVPAVTNSELNRCLQEASNNDAPPSVIEAMRQECYKKHK